MLIVAGHLVLDPSDRDAHVVSSAAAVRLARAAEGCLDFAVSADPVDPGRVNVLERWRGPEDLHAFRTTDTGEEPGVDFERIVAFEVGEYVVGDAA